MIGHDNHETIELVLDAQDRFVSHTLTRNSCGRPVPVPPELLAEIRGLRLDDLLRPTPESLIARLEFADPIDEFLAYKHITAVRAALEVYCGHTSGAPEAPCAAAEITHDPERTIIVARLAGPATPDSAGGYRRSCAAPPSCSLEDPPCKV